MSKECLCANNMKHVMLSLEKHLAELKKQNHELQLRNSELVIENRQLKATSQLGKNHARP
jgi:cell division protein FtsB